MRPGDEAPPGEPAPGENPCPKCGGSGRFNGRGCRHCEGTGRVPQVPGEGSEREERDDERVDREAAETFPASDPPANY
ncbi:MAG: hypothetical protein ACRDLQ_02860, partial [Solirubrobacterales bacterium]